MRRLYQENWFEITLSSFAEPSFFHLAEPDFYEQFYAKLFRAYDSWDALPQSWRTHKIILARWLARQAEEMTASLLVNHENRPLRVFSLGSGLGFVEYNFLKELPGVELHISEPSTIAMDWIRACIPPERIHIGAGLSVLPHDLRFDMIYLSGVDYFLRQHEFVQLLKELHPRLAQGGRLICLSGSFLEDDGLLSACAAACKNALYALLHFSGIRKRQFWGWLRSREEYLAAVREAGYEDIRDGRLEDETRTFWMSGE
ncbi:MAG: class I SAM-dependent methyltransferase [Deltaproteobacteria bacterium]|jgi:SAM-dependent methyltransferase|nr:class I SAM-dependent methyltransferase [Deltaproteobacteria bacterium]